MQRGTVTTKYSLHTGYLTPARIIALKDMLTSDEIEMQIDGQWVPVSVTADTSHAVHQREPESLRTDYRGAGADEISQAKPYSTTASG